MSFEGGFGGHYSADYAISQAGITTGAGWAREGSGYMVSSTVGYTWNFSSQLVKNALWTVVVEAPRIQANQAAQQMHQDEAWRAFVEMKGLR